MAFVCGVIRHRANIPLRKGGAGWPFARVELGENTLLAYTPLFPRRVWTLRVPYAEISEASTLHHLVGGRVRLRFTPNSGDISIVTMNGDYITIADILSKKGVHVTAKRRTKSS